MDVSKIPIDQIDANLANQARCAPCEDTVADYAEKWTAGADFPPVDVFFDGDEYTLADGFHRRDGAVRAGLDVLLCKIHEGGKREAQLFALSANQRHGLRRTNADKRNAVAKMLADGEWSQWSDRRIAAHCGVSHDFASRVRRQLSSNDNGVDQLGRVGKDGRRRRLPNPGKVKDVTDFEPSALEPEPNSKPRKQGAETVRPAQREEAIKLISRLVKVLGEMGIYDQYFRQLDDVLAGVKSS